VSPDEYLIMAAIAVGRHDPRAALAEDLARMESPNSRKPLAEVATDRFPPA
jgi:hypothetical protein